jgi:hypothetical protein
VRHEPPEQIVPVPQAVPVLQQGWLVLPHALHEPPEHVVAGAVQAVPRLQQG